MQTTKPHIVIKIWRIDVVTIALLEVFINYKNDGEPNNLRGFEL